MTVYADFRSIPDAARGHSVALGNFDGLHAGHMAVIDAARRSGARVSPASFSRG